MTRGEAIVAEARAWLGTPWHHGQRAKGIGCDCIGLVGGVALAVGIAEAAQWASDPRWHGYGRTPDPKVLARACAELLDHTELQELRLGDVLLMRFTRDPQHFALVSRLDPVYVIHAYAAARKVVEHRLDEVWRGRVVSAHRFR